ncbi:MAG: copper resistance system multicopper oxidase [Acidiferrobacterales bacterium]|nr:copper resistance system multicopper oxidase [Acidiferrobacterales bacterium]
MPLSLSRRRFVTGLASTTALSMLGSSNLARAATPSARFYQSQPALEGSQFTLNIGYKPVNFTGSTKQAAAVNGSVPSPILRWKEGDRITLDVTNQLAHDSSIHWHGVILPTAMDGVPGLSFAGIKPGQTFRYQFDVNQSGTYWYHSHSGFQEQQGMYGAIVIEPREPAPYSYDREHVIVLSDWSDEDPLDVYANLKKYPHIYNIDERTLNDLANDVKSNGLSQALKQRAMWNTMRMSDTDLSDVTGRTYTFLMNGETPASGWVGEFKQGEKVLLRFINAAAMTFFDVRIPGLKMTVVAADGQNIQGVSVDEFRIGAAETYDVIVEPSSEQAYTLFCQAIDRSGYARGTLTPDPTMTPTVPEMDDSPILSHADMGMAHGDGHSMMVMNNTDCTPEHAAMGHCEMPEQESMECTPEHAAMGHCEIPKKIVQEFATGKAGYGTANSPSFDLIQKGPHIDMLAEGAQYRLDDPGVGLRDNGRRVLTYADLFNLNSTPDPRDPEREIELHLTGNMSRYMWSINGVKYSDAEPLLMKYGERVRITLVNNTMMNHPMHLHGVWSDLETGDGNHIPRKHTVTVQPGSKISYLVTADAIGKWAYHCHLLYHMPSMFREVHIS